MTGQAQELADRINGLREPFSASANGDRVTVQWRWKDAVDFNIPAKEITDEVREFRYYIDILPGNKYKTSSTSTNTNVQISGGKISFGSSSFSGQQAGMHKEISFGKNNKDGNIGYNTYDFSTSRISNPVKELLADMGLKKKGLFL